MSHCTDICILHTNDTHSYLDGFAKRAYIIKGIRKQNNRKGIKTFLFDSGDDLLHVLLRNALFPVISTNVNISIIHY